jgi:hypothetical protein
MPSQSQLHDSGAGQQQQLPYEYVETPNHHHADGDHANSSPGPTAVGTLGETSVNEWSGTLHSNWNGTYAHARALGTEAVGDPYAHAFVNKKISKKNSHSCRKLSTWPKDLQLELVADSEISTLDIQAWIRQTKAPLVRLGHKDGTDKRYFDKLIETIRNARGVSLVLRLSTAINCPTFQLTDFFLPLAPWCLGLISRLFFLTIVRNCEMGEPPELGPTSPRAAWQSPALCCIP